MQIKLSSLPVNSAAQAVQPEPVTHPVPQQSTPARVMSSQMADTHAMPPPRAVDTDSTRRTVNPGIPQSLRLPSYRPEGLYNYGEPFVDDSRINKDRFLADPYLKAEYLDNP